MDILKNINNELSAILYIHNLKIIFFKITIVLNSFVKFKTNLSDIYLSNMVHIGFAAGNGAVEVGTIGSEFALMAANKVWPTALPST